MKNRSLSIFASMLVSLGVLLLIVLTSQAASKPVVGQQDIFPQGTSLMPPVPQTSLISRAANGDGGDAPSVDPAVSANGRYIAYSSRSQNIVISDTHPFTEDIFIYDRLYNLTKQLTPYPGTQANNDSLDPDISGDGQVVVFASYADNWEWSVDFNGEKDVYVYTYYDAPEEITAGQGAGYGYAVLVSYTTEDGYYAANDASYEPAISLNGRYVAFTSVATNLIANDTNNVSDIYVRDLHTGQIERVSIASNGAQGFGPSYQPDISADGRFVVFTSSAPNLVPNDTNNAPDTFLHDRETGLTRRVSVNSSGGQGMPTGTAGGLAQNPSLSANGQFIVFESTFTNLSLTPDSNGAQDIFLHNALSGETRLISRAEDGSQANNGSDLPVISPDAHYVAYRAFANNLVYTDTNGIPDIFVVDLVQQTVSRQSVASDGAQSHGPNGVTTADISADGGLIAFDSDAWDLVPDDSNGSLPDIFLRDRDLPEVSYRYTAQEIDPADFPITDTVAAHAAAQWYKIRVDDPGSTLTATLYNLSGDYNLYLFAPSIDEETGQIRDLGQ
ncbi:MAG: hypothetical protein HC804_09610, partial [Anaerolineae bacterium]|nr:hypothetical protein [Anaerolineae bacterium]